VTQSAGVRGLRWPLCRFLSASRTRSLLDCHPSELPTSAVMVARSELVKSFAVIVQNRKFYYSARLYPFRPYRTVAVIGPHLGVERAPRISLFTFGTGNVPGKWPICLYDLEILSVPVEVGNIAKL